MGEVGDPEQKLTLTRPVPTCVGLTIAYWMDIWTIRSMEGFFCEFAPDQPHLC